ncbi:MAG: protein-export chaperone SecB [Pseudomonadota bacterium]
MAEQPETPPQMNVLTQYVRRVVFENSAAINNKQPEGKPTINVQINVESNDVGENRYIVALLMTVETMNGEDEVFAVELDYIGVFQLLGIPEANLQAVLSIECPRLLFPFARRIIAEVTRDGGYPPLLLDPIDFVSLYRQQLAQAQAEQGDQKSEPVAT